MNRLVVGIFCLACSMPSWLLAWPAPACQPTFSQLPERIVVRSGDIEIAFQAIVIGCSDALSSLAQREFRSMKGALEDLAREARQGLAPIMSLRTYRDDATKRLNTAVGRQVITDVFLYDIGFSEYRDPRPPLP